jgi:hypothetical protein
MQLRGLAIWYASQHAPHWRAQSWSMPPLCALINAHKRLRDRAAD